MSDVLVVVTGGARSGKSAFAERLATDRGGAVTVVVFGEGEGDPEMAERIERHRADRPARWRTLEPVSATGWLGEVGDDELLVVDCLGTLLGRLMHELWDSALGGSAFDEAREVPADYAADVERALGEVVSALVGREGDTIVVTNEVGDGIVPAYALGRVFRDALGRANRALVGSADAAWLVVAGRAIELTALPRDARWPED